MNQLAPLTPALPALADDLGAARDFADQATAASTLTAYASDIRGFETWARQRGIIDPLPASAAAICAFLGWQAARGTKKASSISRAVAALAHWHRTHGIADPPTQSAAVRATMTGIRRTLGTSVDRKAAATDDIVRAMFATIPTSTKRGLRDRALLVTGFAAALRRSELVALQLEDVEWVTEGVRLHIRRSKTDQEAVGYRIPIPRGVRLKPEATIRAWIEAGEITNGHLFRRVNKGDVVSSEPLRGRAVAEILKARVAAAGYDPTVFAGHSLRSGFLTSAAKAGASVSKMQTVSRHKSVDVLFTYIRDIDEFVGHSGEAFL